ncbi:MAG: DUF1778 domain-containing protein [Oscillospiraceae bacterium]|nr:DUF1778 domain-containing protein [Oscillospiraceae bacterium]
MSNKNLDRNGRLRNKMVSFRMSPEENELLRKAVALSGYTRQDYIISKLLNREIVVQPNPRVYKALKTQLENVLAELKTKETSDDLLETIQLISKTLYGIKGGNND